MNRFLLRLFATVTIFLYTLIAASCKNTTDSVDSDKDTTLRSLAKKIESDTLWTHELESVRLSKNYANTFGIVRDYELTPEAVIAANTNAPAIYPTLSDFGSLNNSTLSAELITFLDTICHAISHSDIDTVVENTVPANLWTVIFFWNDIGLDPAATEYEESEEGKNDADPLSANDSPTKTSDSASNSEDAPKDAARDSIYKEDSSKNSDPNSLAQQSITKTNGDNAPTAMRDSIYKEDSSKNSDEDSLTQKSIAKKSGEESPAIKDSEKVADGDSTSNSATPIDSNIPPNNTVKKTPDVTDNPNGDEITAPLETENAKKSTIDSATATTKSNSTDSKSDNPAESATENDTKDAQSTSNKDDDNTNKEDVAPLPKKKKKEKPAVFSWALYGEPFFSGDSIQVPIRFYKKEGADIDPPDILLYVKNTASGEVQYQVENIEITRK